MSTRKHPVTLPKGVGIKSDSTSAKYKSVSCEVGAMPQLQGTGHRLRARGLWCPGVVAAAEFASLPEFSPLPKTGWGR